MDDIANAVAGALLLAGDVKRPTVISDAVLRRSAMRRGGYLPSNVQMPLQAPRFRQPKYNYSIGE